MVEPKHTQRGQESPTMSRTTDHPLAALATALEPYGLRYRFVEDEVPYLRVGNPESRYAVEDIHCEIRERGFEFLSSYDVPMGTSDDIEDAAGRIAWLVGATVF
ncbi:hypothetical protein [Halostreptopolyspora alba]|uniref:Uncharacterized protein n=1 Tax=Halostreptopolyspora alba TaxID=2487137 RepID=A0A3N0E1E5_9ACTN|nr:hypothetical protein EFW17_21805 [Nocardiopsaceae bacterium YIM 96095]